MWQLGRSIELKCSTGCYCIHILSGKTGLWQFPIVYSCVFNELHRRVWSGWCSRMFSLLLKIPARRFENQIAQMNATMVLNKHWVMIPLLCRRCWKCYCENSNRLTTIYGGRMTSISQVIIYIITCADTNIIGNLNIELMLVLFCIMRAFHDV